MRPNAIPDSLTARSMYFPIRINSAIDARNRRAWTKKPPHPMVLTHMRSEYHQYVPFFISSIRKFLHPKKRREKKAECKKTRTIQAMRPLPDLNSARIPPCVRTTRGQTRTTKDLRRLESRSPPLPSTGRTSKKKHNTNLTQQRHNHKITWIRKCTL